MPSWRSFPGLETFAGESEIEKEEEYVMVTQKLEKIQKSLEKFESHLIESISILIQNLDGSRKTQVCNNVFDAFKPCLGWFDEKKMLIIIFFKNTKMFVFLSDYHFLLFLSTDVDIDLANSLSMWVWQTWMTPNFLNSSMTSWSPDMTKLLSKSSKAALTPISIPPRRTLWRLFMISCAHPDSMMNSEIQGNCKEEM